jgi:hypothetical protein
MPTMKIGTNKPGGVQSDLEISQALTLLIVQGTYTNKYEGKLPGLD